MIKHKKSQISIEIMIGVFFVMVFFAGIVYITYVWNGENKITKEYQNENTACLLLANSISRVYSAGDGASVEINMDYDAYIRSSLRAVFIEEKNRTVYCPISFDKVTNLTSGNFLVKKGRNTIKNVQGTVVI